MRYIGKKIALGCLAGVLAATGLTGCSSKMDGSSVAVTVNGEQVPLGVVSFMTRYQQAQTQAMYEMYFGGANDGLWDQVSDEKTGETYGESARDDVVEQVEVMYLLREKAKDYDVKITKKEQKKITEAAKQFIEANSQATLENLAVTQADIETALELQTYEKKMFDPMVADVDTKVSDNEAQQTTVTYVTVEEKDTEEGGDSASANEEEKAKEATAKEKAQQILDEALATANADMDAIAKDVDEELSVTETHFTANPPEKEDDEEEEDIGGVPQSVQDVVKDLADGEVASELVEEDGAYYVVRLEKAFDEESTNEKKDSIISERKQDMYDDMIEDWKDKADIQVDKKVLKTLKVTANRKFTFKQEEETEDVSDNEADQEEVSSNESEEAQDSDQGEDEAPEAQEKDTEE
ncbi:MAG: FKBP-type peptidylprolyl isomerase [Lachnospiraceae bacterium]|nr:FKBP-type peptidylprolyl isomerase [Lachnospiraceae bacterium]